MSTPITMEQMAEDMRQHLADTFREKPKRVLIFDTGEGIYEINEYSDGWSIQRNNGRDMRTLTTLTKGMTEEDMWMMLKLLK